MCKRHDSKPRSSMPQLAFSHLLTIPYAPFPINASASVLCRSSHVLLFITFPSTARPEVVQIKRNHLTSITQAGTSVHAHDSRRHFVDCIHWDVNTAARSRRFGRDGDGVVAVIGASFETDVSISVMRAFQKPLHCASHADADTDHAAGGCLFPVERARNSLCAEKAQGIFVTPRWHSSRHPVDVMRAHGFQRRILTYGQGEDEARRPLILVVHCLVEKGLVVVVLPFPAVCGRSNYVLVSQVSELKSGHGVDCDVYCTHLPRNTMPNAIE